MNTPSPLMIALISAGSAILATLLTIILSPTLQHYFWKRQRREELRLATIDEVNRVTSRFIADYVAGGVEGKPNREIAEFVQLLHGTNARVRALFSNKAARVYSRLMAMIRPTLPQELLDGRVSFGEFLATRDAALRALYDEVGITTRDKNMLSVFERLAGYYRTARLQRKDPGSGEGGNQGGSPRVNE